MFAFGTRPEAIKTAPLIRYMKQDKTFQVVTCVTAQHREMLDQVLEFFDIQPDYDLNLMKPQQSLEELTTRILTELSPILSEVKPDLLFVQGDTTSVMASALAAFYKSIPVAHLEAGLRTGNKQSPFPEEINRILAGHLSEYHFAPTAQALNNLKMENILKNVYLVGNTVIDALLSGLAIINKTSTASYEKFFDFLSLDKKIILVTGHRRENFGEPLRNICQAIKNVANENEDVQFVYPVHLNPNVRDTVHEILGQNSNIKLIEPLSYPYFIWLMSKAYLVLSDSGGIQEEAPSLGKPVLVMREHTERQEGITAGTARLVGTDERKIYTELCLLLKDKNAYGKMANAVNPYGDGTTSAQIVKILKDLL